LFTLAFSSRASKQLKKLDNAVRVIEKIQILREECQPYLKEGMCRGATQTNNTSFLGWMIVYLIIAVGVFSIVNHIIHQHRMIEHQ